MMKLLSAFQKLSKRLLLLLQKEIETNLYLTALGCGLRLGEIIGLKWEDIDFKKETISIKRAVSNIAKVKSDGTREWGVIEHTPKTETSVRTIPIPKTLVNIRRNKVRNA